MVSSAARAFIALLVLIAAVATAAAQQVQVQIDGQPVTFADVQPQMMDGRVLVPIRGVFEQMGSAVNWDEATQSVTCSKDGNDVVLHIGDTEALVNGNPVQLDVAPQVIDDRTMVPMKFLGDALGSAVTWNADNNLVSIDTGSNSTSASSEEATPTPQAMQTVEIRDSEVLPITLDTSLSSTDSRVGDTFAATVSSGDSYADLPAGTKIDGHVAAVEPMTNGQPAVLDLAFDQIVLPDGTTEPIDGSLVSLDDQYVMEGDDGVYMAQNDATSYPRMVYVGYGASTGDLVGVTTSSPLDSDALIDSMATIDEQVPVDERTAVDISLPSGTMMGVRVNHPVTIEF